MNRAFLTLLAVILIESADSATLFAQMPAVLPLHRVQYGYWNHGLPDEGDQLLNLGWVGAADDWDNTIPETWFANAYYGLSDSTETALDANGTIEEDAFAGGVFGGIAYSQNAVGSSAYAANVESQNKYGRLCCRRHERHRYRRY